VLHDAVERLVMGQHVLWECLFGGECIDYWAEDGGP
jgi:hypothetical protein